MITLGTGSLYPYGLNRIFKIARAAGFDGLELMMRPYEIESFWDTWDEKYLADLEKEHNLKIVSLHLPFDYETKPHHWSEIVKLAKQLKIKQIICHIPRQDQPAYTKWFKQYYLKPHQYPFAILAENMGPNKAKGKLVMEDVEQWQKLPAMCFDVAHSMAASQDVANDIAKLNNIKQLHLSEFDRDACHQSILTRPDFFKEILGIKPVGAYCLELCYQAFRDFRDQDDVVAVLKESIALIRQSIPKVG